MTDVTQILSAIEQGDPRAAEQLLPLVYEELRRLAAQKLAQEKPGQTFQATALVHEAYCRLVDAEKAEGWDSRGHFFAAAAEAMRRILVNRARDKKRRKRGGGQKRIDFNEANLSYEAPGADVLSLDEALEKLQHEQPACAQLVKLRFFAGLTQEESARVLGVTRRTADRYWAYARAWLYHALDTEERKEEGGG
jgi:RNA polymerase sigma factor (TIGR02999 family)